MATAALDLQQGPGSALYTRRQSLGYHFPPQPTPLHVFPPWGTLVLDRFDFSAS